MALLCFDVDGTLDTGDGPIPASVLHDLEGMGHKVVIVSPSPLRPKDAGFPEFLSVDRKKNLLDALEAHPDDRPVYISDNDGDDKLSEEVKFEYVHPLFWTPFYTRLTSDGAN